LKRVADATWDGLRSEKDAKKREQYIDQSMKFYRNWIRSGEKQQGAVDPVTYNSVGGKMFQLALMKNGMEPKSWPGTFYQVDISKIPFQEPVTEAAKLFESAVKADTGMRSDFDNSLARYRRGQALGLLQNWKELAREYEEIVKNEELIDADGKLKALPAARPFSTEQVMNDLAWAYAKIASTGDKEAGKRAQELAGKTIRYTDPGSRKPTFAFWFAKYTHVYAMAINGERELAKQTLLEYRRLDREYDNGEFQFKAKFEAIEAQLK
jgi:hypothetical protein